MAYQVPGRSDKQPQASVCPYCNGRKTVEVKGQTLACPKCGGSGTKGYCTK